MKRSRPKRRTTRVPAPSNPRRIRDRLGLTRERFGRLTGFSSRSLANWESGASRPGEQARVRLAEIDRLRAALERVLDAQAIGVWLETPNPAFGGLKPIEVVERGQIDRLWRMAFELESGQAA